MSSVDGDLHPANCEGTFADLQRMAEMLESNPELIDRLGVGQFSFCGTLTPLQNAVHRSHVACVQFLIERGADVDARNTLGYTALYIAIYSKNIEMVRILLENGASANYEALDQRPGQRTINANELSMSSWYFNLACEFGFADIMELLQSYGADVENIRCPLLSSPAHNAVLIKRPDCLLLALRNGAIVNYRQLPPEYQTEENMKASLVHFSISPRFSSPDCVENMTRIWTILREFGDDFYVKDSEGLTPLERLRVTYMPYNHNEALERSFMTILSQPLSLQSLCRIKIRQCMGLFNCHRRLHLLTNIPRDIRAYLNYDKLDQKLDKIQFEKWPKNVKIGLANLSL